MDERATDGTDPARAVAGAMLACDVYIAPTSRSISHTPARKRATDLGIRGATMPGVTEEMLARVMSVDFDVMAERSRAVAKLLDDADSARISTPLGTELTIDLRGRHGISDDGDLTARGAFGNLPCGEAFVSPIGGEGQLVVQSLSPLGISDDPATLTLEAGRLVAAEGGLGPQFMQLLEVHGELGFNLAELGVGTNDAAQLTGLVLEDEKILGTIHVAFGASAGIGGTVSVPIHLDVVAADVTLEIGEHTVLDRGQYVLQSP
jgi:leucyl aminopeptidase (aminopeptidase T)